MPRIRKQPHLLPPPTGSSLHGGEEQVERHRKQIDRTHLFRQMRLMMMMVVTMMMTMVIIVIMMFMVIMCCIHIFKNKS